MVNPEKITTLGTQDNRRNQTTRKCNAICVAHHYGHNYTHNVHNPRSLLHKTGGGKTCHGAHYVKLLSLLLNILGFCVVCFVLFDLVPGFLLSVARVSGFSINN
jgi:hypothetical protein